MIPIIWKSYNKNTPNKGYWDYTIIEDLFNANLWSSIYSTKFIHLNDFEKGIDRAIVVLPARSQVEFVEDLNHDINNLKSVVLFLIGDEEAVFPVDKIQHPNIKIWVMTPHPNKYQKIDRFILNGYSPKIHEAKRDFYERDLDFAFMGQVTHTRREKCVKVLEDLPNGKIVKSHSFTGGLMQGEYYDALLQTKVAPCPSGAVIPDTFRLSESLELGCLPIVDDTSSLYPDGGYWKYFFKGESPFPIFTNYDDLAGMIRYYLDIYPEGNNRVFAWWQSYKRQLTYNLVEDLIELGFKIDMHETIKSEITIIIPTSPIASHPDTKLIEETIKTIRNRLPYNEMIIMFDGVRSEQLHRKPDYDKYIQKMLWKCNNEYYNVLPIVFKEHRHQAYMTREALRLVKTKNILFVEHDTPLCEEIPFDKMVGILNQKLLNVIRLNHEALILPEHKYLMLDSDPINLNEIPIIRTGQWSQRPHLASTEFYINMLDKYFTADSRTMIEDRIHGFVHSAFVENGKNGWNDFKVGIYAPVGDMKRSYNLDGRGSDPKFEMIF